MAENFWKMSGFSLHLDHYAYVDHKSYLADEIFAREGLRVKIDCRMAKSDSPYRVVFCSARKSDRIKFENAMERLKDHMLLCGHADYEEACGFLTEMINQAIRNLP